MKVTLKSKLEGLTDTEVIQLVNELKSTTVAEDALIRQVIKDTELDTTSPILAFIGVGNELLFELAKRFESKTLLVTLYRQNRENQ